MIPIKIQCGCGQRYAFDVEPVHGRMPSPVACPVCGADGTAAANELIARNSPPAPPPTPSTGTKLSTPAHSAVPSSAVPSPAALTPMRVATGSSRVEGESEGEKWK
jgi:hypothetical protein